MKHTKARAVSVAVSLVLAVTLGFPSGTVLFAESMPERVPVEDLLAGGDYVEGEAVAIVKANARFSKLQNEELSEVSSDAVEEAVEAADLSELPQAEAAEERLQNGAEEYSVQLFTDHSRTTKELLEELYRNPAVISAEPNYVIQAANEDATEAGDAKTVSNKALLSEAGASGIYQTGDLTPMQWYLSDTEHRYSSPFSPEPSYLLNVPGWREGRTSETAPANASGTVCVMDTGIDTEHPDLKNVLFSFSEEQQERYGCGPHGINVSFGEDEYGNSGDITDHHQHGTHVAGIIAAEWNAFGTSGIANGIKIFGARIFGDDGMGSSTSSAARAFQFLIDVAKEVNLKAVNCSWGNMRQQFILTTLVNDLGKQGAVTVFASGNASQDMDEIPDSGPCISSVYCINVNAASANGKKCSFSNYGKNSTDLFTSGENIVSTVPETVRNLFDDGSVSSRRYFERFYPEVSEAEGLLYGPNTFASGEKGRIRVFDSNPVLNENAEELSEAKVSREAGFDDKCSLAVHVEDMKDLEVALNSDLDKTKRGFYLAIPVERPEDVRWISAKTAISDAYRTVQGLATVTFQRSEDGKPVEVDHSAVLGLVEGYNATSVNNTYQGQWTPLSYNVQGFLDSVNQVHEMSEEERREAFPLDFKYEDPGELAGVYGWEDDGETYLIVSFALNAGDPAGPKPDENTVLYMDNVAVGNENAWTGAYETMAGTSMATPTVTGSLAVIAKDEPDNAVLPEETLKMQALSRAAKLLAAVDYDDENLLPYCRTGGRLNLRGQTTYTKKAPLISRADVVNSNLVLNGYFFGDRKGSLTVDGTPYKTTTWTDGTVIADLSGLSNGSHTAMVTNTDGARMQALFSFSSDAAKGLSLYERSLSLPTGVPEFDTDRTDYLDGDMTALDGSLYVFTKNVRGECIALWRYNINTDDWVRCADLPDSIQGENVDGMAAWGGKLYVSAPPEIGCQTLWAYDPVLNQWASVDMELTIYGGKLCTFGKHLFYIPGYGAEWFDERKEEPEDGQEDDPEEDDWSYSSGAQISIIDPEMKTVTKLEGEAVGAKYAASGKYLYALSHQENDPVTGEANQNALLYRGTYDSKKGCVIFEDLSDQVKGLFCEGDTMEEIQIGGFDDGVVLVGNTKNGCDTYVLMDSGNVLKPHERTSSYHRPNRVTAAVSDGWLFVFAGGQTENDSAYFRATKMPKAAEEKEPAPVVIRIQPKGTSITKLKKGRKSFTVKWKKQTKQTTGYQIQYSTKRNFKSGRKTVSVRKNTITKKKIKKLKAKKTYYVRIRTYKKTGGKYYYSAWSKVKKVKTK